MMLHLFSFSNQTNSHSQLAFSRALDRTLLVQIANRLFDMSFLTGNDPGVCRMTNTPGAYGLQSFSRLAGANCFRLLNLVFNFEVTFPFAEIDNGLLIANDIYSNVTLDLSKRADIDVFRKHLAPATFDKWESCYDAAVRCCRNVMSATTSKKELATGSRAV